MKNLTWQNPEQLFVAQELINKVKSKCCGIKVCENLPYVIAYLQTLCYCLPEIKINSYRNAVDAYTSFYTVEKSASNLFIGHYLYLLARHEEIADWENVALQNMEAGTANLRQIPLSLAQTIDTLSVLKYYSQTHTKLITQLEKLFKFYSKIILWQRYASWLRAYRPCIHSQWSVS